MSLHEKASSSEMEKGIPGPESGSPAESIGGIHEEWTVEDEKRLRNKMDWNIIPMVTLLYLLCFLDRYANGRELGLETPLRLKGHANENNLGRISGMREFRECNKILDSAGFGLIGR